MNGCGKQQNVSSKRFLLFTTKCLIAKYSKVFQMNLYEFYQSSSTDNKYMTKINLILLLEREKEAGPERNYSI